MEFRVDSQHWRIFTSSWVLLFVLMSGMTALFDGHYLERSLFGAAVVTAYNEIMFARFKKKLARNGTLLSDPR